MTIKSNDVKGKREVRDNTGAKLPEAQESAQEQDGRSNVNAHLSSADLDPNEVLKHDPLRQVKDREYDGPPISNADPRVDMTPDPLIGYKGDPKYNPSTNTMLREALKEEDNDNTTRGNRSSSR